MVLPLNIWAEVEDYIVDPVRKVLREVEDNVVKMQSDYTAMQVLTQVNVPNPLHCQKCAKNNALQLLHHQKTPSFNSKSNRQTFSVGS
jgi:hypothetical protein